VLALLLRLVGLRWGWMKGGFGVGSDEGGFLGWVVEKGVEGGEVAEGEKREGSMWWMGRRWEIG